MKLYKSLLLVAAVAGLFSSCSEDGYWDAYDTKSTATYSFAQSANSYSLTPADTFTNVTVTVNRNTNKGAVTLPVNLAVSSDIITADTNVVVFQDGSYTTDFSININSEGIVLGNQYKAELEFVVDSVNFTEKNYSISGNNKYTLSFMIDYNWVSAGDGILASSWTGKQTKIQFQKAAEYTDEADNGYYRFAYTTGNYINFYLDAEGNALYIAPGFYSTGMTEDGVDVELYYNPSHSTYGGYCTFVNNGNLFGLNGLWYLDGSLYVCKDQFLWQTGWPGAN